MTAAELRARECVAELDNYSGDGWCYATLAAYSRIVTAAIEAALEDEREAQCNALQAALAGPPGSAVAP